MIYSLHYPRVIWSPEFNVPWGNSPTVQCCSSSSGTRRENVSPFAELHNLDLVLSADLLDSRRGHSVSMSSSQSKEPSSKKDSIDDPFQALDKEHGEPFLDWKHPLTLHPWYFAHQALRADFEDNIAALDKMIAAIEVGVYCRYEFLPKLSASNKPLELSDG